MGIPVVAMMAMPAGTDRKGYDVLGSSLRRVRSSTQEEYFAAGASYAGLDTQGLQTGADPDKQELCTRCHQPIEGVAAGLSKRTHHIVCADGKNGLSNETFQPQI